MQDPTKDPVHAPGRQPLPVLKHSGKVEQLKDEIRHESSAVAAPPRAPQPLLSGVATHVSDPDLPPELRAVEMQVVAAIRQIYDPEIPVNIYDLGLIYEIRVAPGNHVKVVMTLTAPACPVAGEMPGQVEAKVEAIPGVASADVNLVWEPAWDKSRMSEAAMLDLGFL